MTTNLYALIESRIGHENFGKPFYIGIGTAKRPRRHFIETKAPSGHRNWRLHEVLTSHFAFNIEPEIRILAVFTTKEEACIAERAEIAKWCRASIETDGILCNRASGGQGPDSDLMRLPETRERNAEAQRNVAPEIKAARSATLKAIHADPVLSARKSEASKGPQKNSWKDPEIRANRIAGMKGVKKTPSAEALAARRANAQKTQSPEAKAKRSAELKARWADPAYKERLAAKKRAQWADPEKRARMLAARTRRNGGEEAAATNSIVSEGEHSGQVPD